MGGQLRVVSAIRVAVLMGGISKEREVSLKSGKAVLKALQNAGLQAEAVDIQGPDFDLPSGTDVAFLALHGTFGEDGQIQRILEERGIAYTGSDPQSSELAFDKVLAKERFVQSLVPVPCGYEIIDASVKLHLFGLPLVIKPARQGSTIGVSVVRRGEDFRAACLTALEHDTRALVESYIQGRELTVGILGDRALPVIEIVPESGFFDYAAKYTKGATKYICPARLTENERLLTQEVALRAFRSLGCRDYGRVDVILSDEGTPFVLEVNTLPGMTETSLLPMAAAEAGFNFSELCLLMVEMALNRCVTCVTRSTQPAQLSRKQKAVANV